MNFSIDDIDVFVATYNRAEYLKESIASLLNQSAGKPTITVLDNNSTDHTESVVSLMSGDGVEYIKTFGFLGNFKAAQRLAKKEYIIVFHDDDILHPKYFELALDAINKYQNLSVITSNLSIFFNNDTPKIPINVNDLHYYSANCEEFSQKLFLFDKIGYAATLYKTDYFKNSLIEYDKFSKLNDKPFMAKAQQDGAAVYLHDKNLLFTRSHSSQDTVTSTNTPSVEQLTNWFIFFYNQINPSHNEINKIRIYYKIRLYSLSKNFYNSFLSAKDKDVLTLKEFQNNICDKIGESRLIYNNKVIGWIFKYHDKKLLKRHLFEMKKSLIAM